MENLCKTCQHRHQDIKRTWQGHERETELCEQWLFDAIINRGHVECLKLFLSVKHSPEFNINILKWIQHDGSVSMTMSTLANAILNQRPGIFKILIDNGADVNYDVIGRTIFCFACCFNRPYAKVLLLAKADPGTNLCRKNHCCALHRKVLNVWMMCRGSQNQQRNTNSALRRLPIELCRETFKMLFME
jgi:hypothetical protein